MLRNKIMNLSTYSIKSFQTNLPISQGFEFLQGALVILSPPYWAYNEAYIEVTETCNTSMNGNFLGFHNMCDYKRSDS